MHTADNDAIKDFSTIVIKSLCDENKVFLLEENGSMYVRDVDGLYKSLRAFTLHGRDSEEMVNKASKSLIDNNFYEKNEGYRVVTYITAVPYDRMYGDMPISGKIILFKEGTKIAVE